MQVNTYLWLDAGFLLYSGDDASAREFVTLGGDGVISVTANVAPREMQTVMQAANDPSRTGPRAETKRAEKEKNAVTCRMRESCCCSPLSLSLSVSLFLSQSAFSLSLSLAGLDAARELDATLKLLHRDLFCEANPIPVKREPAPPDLSSPPGEELSFFTRTRRNERALSD